MTATDKRELQRLADAAWNWWVSEEHLDTDIPLVLLLNKIRDLTAKATA